jgi:hypothetical protein
MYNNIYIYILCIYIYIYIYLFIYACREANCKCDLNKEAGGGIEWQYMFSQATLHAKTHKKNIYTHAEKCIASVPWIKKCQHFGLCHMTSGWHRGEELTCMALVWLLSCYKFKEGRSTIEEVAERRSRTRGFQSKHIFLILFSWHKGMQDSVLGEKKLSPGPSIDS